MRSEQGFDPASSWWAKHAHANDHIARLAKMCADFRDSDPIAVLPRKTSDPTVIEYVFRENQPIPPSVSLVVGDILHSLRSALDSLIYGIAETRLGGEGLTDQEVRACQFPIYAEPVDFDEFFKNKHRARTMKEPLKTVLRKVQPFYWMEYTEENYPDIEITRTYLEDAVASHLWSVARLSNIDKHRRLPITAWWPDLFYWTHDGESDHLWRPQGRPPWQDGEVIGTLEGSGPEPLAVIHTFNLALMDDLAGGRASRDLPEVASTWASQVERTIREVLLGYLNAQDEA